MSRRACHLAFALLACVAPCVANAQIFGVTPVGRDRVGKWSFDVGAQFARPIGEFHTQVDHAWGIGGSVRYHLPSFAPLGVRGDLTFLNYGNENQRVPLSPTINRVLVDMSTTNNIFLVSGGPELALRSGSLRPYVYAFAGYAYFYTESSVGDDNGGNFANTTNFGDGGLATGGGGGIRIPLHVRTVGLSFDAGARFTQAGTRSYLKPGDVLDQPDGTLQFTPRKTKTDFWQYHLGVSISPRFR
jgi:hypothetical protein